MLTEDLVLESTNLILKSRIEVGGQASIWKVQEIGPDGRTLAAKLIEYKRGEQDHPNTKKQIDNLARERGILKDIEHRYIMDIKFPVDELFVEENIVVTGYVMNLSPVGTIKEFIEKKSFNTTVGAVPLDKAKLIRQLALAVESIHVAGVIHSDIKAENVLLEIQNSEFIPKLIDFGGAFRTQDPATGMGSTPYLSPERVNGGDATKSSDIYAFGVLVSEILIEDRLDQPSPNLFGITQMESRFSVYEGLLKTMLAPNPENRPDAGYVKSAFENKEVDATRSISVTKTIKFPLGKYLWHDKLHQLYNGSKVFVFLRSVHPTADARRLRDALDHKKLMGMSIHRVFGALDFYVEGWITHKKVNSLNEAINKFVSSQPHTGHLGYEPDYFFVKNYSRGSPLKKLTDHPGDLLGVFYNHFEMEKQDDRVEKYILGEYSAKNPRTKYILRIDTQRQFTEHQMMALHNRVLDYISGCKHLTKNEKIDTKIMSAHKDGSKVVVSMSVKRIQTYRDVMLGIARYIAEQSTSNKPDGYNYSTYIDMDGNGFVDGDQVFFRDDGMIPTRLVEEY